LCRKAGLPDNAWKEGARLERFRAQVFHALPGQLALQGDP